MTFDEKKALKGGEIVEYKRNGQLGARRGTFIGHTMRGFGDGTKQVAYCRIRPLDGPSTRMKNLRLSNVLKVIEQPGAHP